MINGKQTILRPVEEADIPYIVAWTLDPEIQRLVEGDYPLETSSAQAWKQQVQSNRHKRYYVILAEDERPIGDLELDHIAWRSGEAELRIRIGEKSLWNRGYGTDAISHLLEHAFDDIGLRRIYLRVFAENRRAIRCYRKCGFRPEGVLVRSRDGSADTPARRILLMRILDREFHTRQLRKKRGTHRPISVNTPLNSSS